MNVLDDPQAIDRLDKSGMLELVDRLPEMMVEAAGFRLSPELSVRGKVRNVVIAGMGGSAISGDIAEKLAFDVSPIPVRVSRGYSIPSYVSAETLFIALSYSGNTEETLSAYAEAASRNSIIAAVTSGGKLAEEAGKNARPIVNIPKGLPPRASMPYLLIPLLGVLNEAGAVRISAAEIDAAAGVLRELREKYKLSSPAENNQAKRLARALNTSMPVFLGTSEGSDVAAYRWKTQLAENSKRTSVANTFPEMDHNEIVNLADVSASRQGIKVVVLSTGTETAQMRKRVDITKKLIASSGVEVEEVKASGGTILERILSLMYLGDYVSVYIALLNGMDPTPVEAIESLKKELA